MLGHSDQEQPFLTEHDSTSCECLLCCLKRENSREDRPGESLEQIISRAAVDRSTRQVATTQGSRRRSHKFNKKSGNSIAPIEKKRRNSKNLASSSEEEEEDSEETEGSNSDVSEEAQKLISVSY